MTHVPNNVDPRAKEDRDTAITKVGKNIASMRAKSMRLLRHFEAEKTPEGLEWVEVLERILASTLVIRRAVKRLHEPLPFTGLIQQDGAQAPIQASATELDGAEATRMGWATLRSCGSGGDTSKPRVLSQDSKRISRVS